MEKEGITKGIIAIGDNLKREKMFKKIKSISHNFDFISAIHPSASISNYSTIGRGVAVMAGTVINAEAEVGDFSIVNTKASLGHDSILEKYSSLSSGVTVGGNVTIGKFTAISIGATIVNNITIGKHTIIGAGAVVTRKIGNFQVAYGIPAKFVQKRNKGDNYLTSNDIN
jgi:sugar O-acyltransferase (sialic acid O-acetyltransferase NeuD family)